MRGVFKDYQVVMMGNKESFDLHTPSLKSMTVDMATIERRTRKGF